MMTNPPTISDLVNLLFETIHRPDGKAYTEREVAETVDVTQKTLNHIRNSRTSNPGISTVREICRFFGVSLDYFAVSSVEECYQYLSEREHPNAGIPSVNEITFRAMELSEESRKHVLEVIGWVKAAENQANAQGEGNGS